MKKNQFLFIKIKEELRIGIQGGEQKLKFQATININK